MLAGMILNGWQRIKRVDGNNTPLLGSQITFKPNKKIFIKDNKATSSNSFVTTSLSVVL